MVILESFYMSMMSQSCSETVYSTVVCQKLVGPSLVLVIIHFGANFRKENIDQQLQNFLWHVALRLNDNRARLIRPKMFLAHSIVQH